MISFAITAALCIQSQDWKNDPALAKPITIRADAEPVGDFIGRLAKEAGVQMSADASVAQDRVVLTVKDLPAKDLMEKIASHFSWSWRMTKNGLQLWQTPEQAKAETDLFWKLMLEPLKKRRQASMDAVATRSKVDVEASKARLGKLFEIGDDLLSRYEAEYLKGSEEKRRAWVEARNKNDLEIQGLSRAISPSWLAVDSVIANLTDRDLQDLVNRRRLVFAYSPNAAQRPMPRAAKAAIEDMLPTLALGSNDANQWGTERGNMLRALDVNLGRAFTPAELGNVRIVVKLSEMPANFVGDGGLEAPSITVVSKKGEILTSMVPYASARPMGPKALPPKVEQQPKDRMDDPLAVSDELRRLVTPVPGQRGLPATFEAEKAFLTRGGRAFASSGTARLLNGIAESAHVNLISDCLDANRFTTNSLIPLQSARSGFRALAAQMRETWTLNGKWVEFRDSAWPVARAYTIPSDKLLQIRDLLLEQFSLDAGAKVAGLLSDFQSQGMALQAWAFSRWDLSFRGDENGIDILRLWNDLSRQQRTALVAGQTIYGSSLNSRQRADIYRHIERMGRAFNAGAYSANPVVDPSDYEWLNANWGYPNEGLDDEVTEILPHGIPRDAAVSLHQAEGDGIEFTNKEGWKGRMSASDAVQSGYYKAENQKFQMRTLKEFRSYFTFDLFENFRRGFVIRGFGPPSEKVYDSPSELPEALRNRLDEAYKKRHGGGSDSQESRL